MCMYVCARVYIHTYACVCVYIHMRVYIYINMRICIHSCCGDNLHVHFFSYKLKSHWLLHLPSSFGPRLGISGWSDLPISGRQWVPFLQSVDRTHNPAVSGWTLWQNVKQHILDRYQVMAPPSKLQGLLVGLIRLIGENSNQTCCFLDLCLSAWSHSTENLFGTLNVFHLNSTKSQKFQNKF